MRFYDLPVDFVEKLATNAGILLTDFTPATGAYSQADIFAATTGGISASIVPTYKDYGEDVDNCPKNSKEMKMLDSVECKISGTALTITPPGEDAVNGSFGGLSDDGALLLRLENGALRAIHAGDVVLAQKER